MIHTQHGVFAQVHIVQRLQGRGSGTQHNATALHFGTQHGEIPPVVARRILLFIGRIVLLIHDNEPAFLHRCEYGGARSDGNTRPAAAYGMPLIETLTIAHGTVQNGHRPRDIRKATLEASQRLRCQRDFRHKNQDSFPLLQGH